MNNSTTAIVASSNLSLEEQQRIDHLNGLTDDIKKWYIWVIFAFGFPGNLLSLAIILKLRCFGSPAVYVGTLAVVDNLAIVVKLLLINFPQHEVVLGLYSCKLLFFFGNFLQVYANWVLVTMAIERFVAVWQPLHVASNWTPRRAVVSLIIVMVLTAALNAPVGVFVLDKPERFACVVDPEYRSMASVWQWIQVVAYGFVPCALLITLNILIIVLIRRATRHQRTMTGSTSPTRPLHASTRHRTGVQSQVTALLVLTSALLVLTTTPVCVYMLVQTWWRPERGTLRYAQKRIISALVRAVCDANHSVNFYLYFISARKFRIHFYNAICWLCRMRSRNMRRRSTHTRQQSNLSASRSTIKVKDRSSGYLFLFKRKRSRSNSPNDRLDMKPLTDGALVNGHAAKTESPKHSGSQCD